MDIRAIFMGLAFAFMWSSAFTSARIFVADAPPLYSLSLRFFISGVIGVAIIMGARSVRQASAGGNLMMIVGLQMFVGSFALLLVAPFFETLPFKSSLCLAMALSYTVLVPGLLATFF